MRRITSDNIIRRPDADPFRYGDLVLDEDGYHGLILSIAGQRLGVFLCNGLTVERSQERFARIHIHGSTAAANFAEAMKVPVRHGRGEA